MQHQAKVETGKGLPPPKGSAAWLKQQAKLNGPNPAEQLAKQALVQQWLQAEVQGWSGKPGDKPSIAGAHRLYEQHMRASGSTDMPMGRNPFLKIARGAEPASAPGARQTLSKHV
jgi:hypothetical protein